MQYGRLAIGTLFAAAASWPALAANPGATPAATPGAMGRAFDITLSAQVAHDSDLPRTSAAQAALSGLVLDDTTYTPTLSIDGRLPVGRQSLFFNGLAAYDYHANNTTLDSERVNVTGGIDGRFGPCAPRALAGYQRSLIDLQDVVLTSTVTDKLEVTRVEFDVTCARSTGLGLTGSASQDWGNHSSTQLRTQDYREESFTGGVSYARPVLGTITLLGTYSKIEYPHRPLIGGRETGVETVFGGVSYDRHLGARIEGTVKFGYSSVDQLVIDPAFPAKNFSGFTYSATVRYQATPRLSANFQFDKSVKPSDRLGSDYDIVTNYRVEGRYDMTHRIKFNLGYDRNEFNSSATGLLAVNTLTNSRTNTVFGGVRYDLSKHLSFNLNGSDEQRTANNALFNYRDDRVAASVTVRY